jgi:hypothetical protein
MAGRCNFWRPRRLIAGLALIAYLSAIFGLPLRLGPVKDHRQRYPCEGHPCGCSNAEDCWRHCCCLTPEERWAWARANGVEPPPYAERPASEEGRTAREDTQSEEETCPNCRRQREGKDDASSTSSKSCCRGHSCCDAQSPSPVKGRQHAPGSPWRWVAGLAELQCRALSPLWVASGAVLPLPTAVTWAPGLRPVGWVPSPAAVLPSIALPPPVPPPRGA